MSSITDSTMSLNVMTVTLNMGEFYCCLTAQTLAKVIHIIK